MTELPKTKALGVAVIVAGCLLAASFPIYSIHPAIDVTFNAQQDKPVEYQVYYTTEPNQKFSVDYSVKQKVDAGVHDVKITLPVDQIKQFRLDPGEKPGKVTILNLVLEGKEKVPLNLTDFSFHRLSHKVLQADKLTFSSDHADPLMIYKKTIEIQPYKGIDWRIFALAGMIYLLILYRLFLRLFRVQKVIKSKK